MVVLTHGTIETGERTMNIDEENIDEEKPIPIEQLESINRQRFLQDKISLHGRFCRCKYCLEYYEEKEEDYYFSEKRVKV